MATNRTIPEYSTSRNGFANFKGGGVRNRPVFKRGTNVPSDSFRKYIQSNINAVLPEGFAYVLNVATGRFLKSADLYDKRRKVPTLRKAYQGKEVFNGRIREAVEVVYSNTVTYTDYIVDWDIITDDNGDAIDINYYVKKTQGSVDINTTHPLVLTSQFWKHGYPRPRLDELTPEINWLQIPNPHTFPGFNEYKYLYGTGIKTDKKKRESYQIKNALWTEISGSDPDKRRLITGVTHVKVDKTTIGLGQIKMYNAKLELANERLNKKFKDSGEMMCVPEALHWAYCEGHLMPESSLKEKKNLKLSIDQIVDELLEGTLTPSPEYERLRRLTKQGKTGGYKGPLGNIRPPLRAKVCFKEVFLKGGISVPADPTPWRKITPCERAWKQLTPMEQYKYQRMEEDDKVRFEYETLRKTVNRQGFTSNDIRRFCVKHSIRVHACNVDEKSFDTYMPTPHKKQFNVFAYQIFGGHLHLYEDKKFIQSLSAKASGTATNTNLRNSQQWAKDKKADMVIKDTDVVLEVPDLRDLLIKDIFETNKLPATRDIQINNNQVLAFKKSDGTRVYANPDYAKVQAYVNQYNSTVKTDECKLENTNQSVNTFGRHLWKQLYPNHKQSDFNIQVMDMMTTHTGIVAKYNASTRGELCLIDWVFNDDDMAVDLNGDEINLAPQLVAVDINKCRTARLVDNRLGVYKRVTAMDEFKPFDQHSQLEAMEPLAIGEYYVLTDNMLPAQGNRVYSNGFVDYLQKEGIVFTVVYQMLIDKSNTYGEDYLHSLYNEMVSYPDFKSMSNAVIGSLASTATTKSDWCLETDFESAKYYFFNQFTDDKVTGLKDNGKKQKVLGHDGISRKETFIRPLTSDEHPDLTLYSIESKVVSKRLNTDIPIFNQIIENEWIAVYELRKKLGGKLIEIKTDCVVVQDPTGEVTYDKEIGGYKPVDAAEVAQEMIEAPAEQPQKNVEVAAWNITKEDEFMEVDDEDYVENFRKIVKHYHSAKQSCLISGEGGFGKSWLLKEFQLMLDHEGVSYATLAPTGKACLNINGQTIHSFLGLDHDMTLSLKMLKKIHKYEVLLVDEISMVGATLLGFLQLAKQQNPDLRVYFFGDLKHQLLPIGEEQYDYENSLLMKWLCDYNQLEMTIYKRGDNKMLRLSRQAFATGKVNPADYGTFDVTDAERHLCFTNIKRHALNDVRMQRAKEQHPNNYLFIEATKLHKETNDKAQDVWLTPGCPVMACHKQRDLDIVNNEDFEVVSWGDVSICLKKPGTTEGEFKTIPISLFHFMFTVSYAMTIHKAQGATFDFKYTIHERHNKRFSKRMLYTAITRSRINTNVCFCD